MPNPAWITSENVKFNGTLDNAAVLKTDGDIRSLILWDDLSESDKTILIDFIDTHGGELPLADSTFASQTVDFAGVLENTTPTGLNDVSWSSGIAYVDLGSAITDLDPSGLPSSAGTHGAQVVNFDATISGSTPTGLAPYSGYLTIGFSAITGSTATGIPNDTSGYQFINVGGAVTSVSATGLIGATTYTTDITVEGNLTTISVLGSDAPTYADLLTEINGQLTGAVATINGGNLKITSSTTGLLSSISISDVTLFDALTTFVSIVTPVDGTSPEFTATLLVDGDTVDVTVAGRDAQTFDNLVDAILTNLDVTGTSTIALDGNNIVISSVSFGITSTVEMDDVGTLFTSATIPSLLVINAPVSGNSIDTLDATITIDGVDHILIILPADITLFSDLIGEINSSLGPTAVASISGGDIVVTSNSVGITSTVAITAGTLFPSLAEFSYVLPPQNGGGTARNYSAIIIVDGIINSVTFTGLEGDTYANVVDEINNDLNGSAIAAIDGQYITITADSVGPDSSVKIYDVGSLFSSLIGYVGYSDVVGTFPVAYTASFKINADVTIGPISMYGIDVPLFGDVIDVLNAEFGLNALAEIYNGNIKITSSTPTAGVTSTLSIVDGNLFRSLGAIGILPSVRGIDDLLAATSTCKSPNGSLISSTFDILTVGAKPAVLPNTQHSTEFVYWDGVWKYLDDDTIVND